MITRCPLRRQRLKRSRGRERPGKQGGIERVRLRDRPVRVHQEEQPTTLMATSLRRPVYWWNGSAVSNAVASGDECVLCQANRSYKLQRPAMEGSWGHHSPREISADKDVPSAAESRKKLRPISRCPSLGSNILFSSKT